MKAIVNVNSDWGIGKDGHLLCSFEEDMTMFKYSTKGNVIICGKKTLDSFPGGKPLPGRINIVVTHDKMSISQEVKESTNYYVSVLRAKNKEASAIVGVTKYKEEFNDIADNPTTLVVVQDISLVMDVVKVFGRGKETFLCGGSSIYNQLLKYCNHVLVTKNDFTKEEPDTFFPNLDEDSNWKVIYESPEMVSSEAGIRYKFVDYERVEKEL